MNFLHLLLVVGVVVTIAHTAFAGGNPFHATPTTTSTGAPPSPPPNKGGSQQQQQQQQEILVHRPQESWATYAQRAWDWSHRTWHETVAVSTHTIELVSDRSAFRAWWEDTVPHPALWRSVVVALIVIALAAFTWEYPVRLMRDYWRGEGL